MTTQNPQSYADVLQHERQRTLSAGGASLSRGDSKRLQGGGMREQRGILLRCILMCCILRGDAPCQRTRTSACAAAAGAPGWQDQRAAPRPRRRSAERPPPGPCTAGRGPVRRRGSLWAPCSGMEMRRVSRAPSESRGFSRPACAARQTLASRLSNQITTNRSLQVHRSSKFDIVL